MADTGAYTGRCACERVTLRIDGKPLATRQCWCRQCQQIASGGPTNNAMFRTEDVTITGDVASASWQANSGNSLTFSFCPACGTQIYAQSSARPHIMTMRLGAIDVPHDLKPELIIWAEDAPAWAVFDTRLEILPRQAPAPASASTPGT